MNSTNSNREVAIRWFEEAWNQKRVDCIADLTAPNIVAYHEGLTSKGHEGMKQMHQLMLESFPGVTVKVLRSICDGDDAVVHWQFSVPASDKIPQPVDFTGMTWMKFADGKIVEGWDCWNRGELTERIAAMKA